MVDVLVAAACVDVDDDEDIVVICSGDDGFIHNDFVVAFIGIAAVVICYS